jgi:serine/threonine-protein kinase
MIMRAVDEIALQSAAGSDLILPVYLSVARATSTERLLFAVVRRIFEAVSDSGLLSRLPAHTRHALLVAYMRTSLAFKETQAEARERGASLDLGGAKTLVDLAVPKLSMSAKRSRSLATEAAFLAYSETDVEHDLMRIVSLVDQATFVTPLRRQWLGWLRRRSPVKSGRPHLVIVLDEVDKLTLDPSGMVAVEDLLNGIKNVLTMPGAHFLVVAGPDLHDRALRDSARGTGVYESVFGWRMYMPCNWDAPRALLADLVRTDAAATHVDELSVLAGYLRFKARGVPRRLLQEINAFVVWDGMAPRLRISEEDMNRVAFYANMEGILGEYFSAVGSRPLFRLAIDQDRWRLGGYYVLDWVLQSEGEPFSAAELLSEEDDPRFDPLLRISRRDVEPLLVHLAKHDVLTVVREMNANATVFADIAEASATVYRLNPEILKSVFGIAAQNETERAALDISLTGLHDQRRDGPVTEFEINVPAVPLRVVGGRYELLDLLGQGGMGSVYKGRDVATGRPVAVKLLRSSLGKDALARARLQREAELAKSLDHPQIVRTYEVLQEADGSPALVMELLQGQNLTQIVSSARPMSPAETAAIGSVLAAALDYISEQGIVRLDLKPSNVIMADRGPVIIDLGIAVRPATGSALTRAGQLVGTPAYMAPELIEGKEPDPRADQYALALVLYYCLTGRTPWDDINGVPALIIAVMTEDVDTSGLPVSAEFKQVLSRALARDRDQRYPGAADFRDALLATPERRSLAAGPSAASVDSRPNSRVGEGGIE